MRKVNIRIKTYYMQKCLSLFLSHLTVFKKRHRCIRPMFFFLASSFIIIVSTTHGLRVSLYRPLHTCCFRYPLSQLLSRSSFILHSIRIIYAFLCFHYIVTHLFSLSFHFHFPSHYGPFNLIRSLLGVFILLSVGPL